MAGLPPSSSPVLEDLKEKAPESERDPKLEQLVNSLAEQDSLFHYNVPPIIRESSDNQKLFEHLKSVYTQSEFVIDNADVIKRYVQAGDRVTKKGEYKETAWSLRPGDRGSVTQDATDGEKEVKVFFNGREATIEKKYLGVIGSISFWGNEILLSSSESYPALGLIVNKRQIVEYRGEVIEDNTWYIPDGTHGIVIIAGSSRSIPNLSIAWDRTPGTKAYSIYQGREYSHKDKLWGYHDIKLIRKNKIDFEKLAQEILGDHDGK